MVELYEAELSIGDKLPRLFWSGQGYEPRNDPSHGTGGNRGGSSGATVVAAVGSMRTESEGFCFR